MKISCLPKEGSRLLMTVFIEEEPWRDIHTKIFGRQPLLPESDSLAAFQEKFKKLEYVKAKKYALDCLALRSYLSIQMKKLLKRNLVSEETIEEILQECTRLGYLNDNEWLEGFVKRQLARHTGPQRIICQLMNKGISRVEAHKYVGMYVQANTSQHSIQHLINTKYKTRNLADYREKQKVFAALIRKGFDIQAVKDTLKVEE